MPYIGNYVNSTPIAPPSPARTLLASVLSFNDLLRPISCSACLLVKHSNVKIPLRLQGNPQSDLSSSNLLSYHNYQRYSINWPMNGTRLFHTDCVARSLHTYLRHIDTVNADYLAPQIHQRHSTVTGLNGCICLDRVR